MKDKWITAAEVQERMACIEQLASLKCQCGRGKQRGMAVCYKCWRMLPEDMRRALYKSVGEGYEQAYARACEILRDVPHRCAPRGVAHV